MTEDTNVHSLAEQRAEKARKARIEADANMVLFRAEQQAIEERTARLRALRLAREAANAASMPTIKTAKARKQ